MVYSKLNPTPNNMNAKSISGGTVDQIRISLNEAISDGFRPTVAFAFISIKQDRQEICRLLRAEEIEVVGATSSGEFIDGHQTEGGAAILLLELDRDYYKVLFTDIQDVTPAEAAARMAGDALKEFSRPAFLLCSTLLAEDGAMLDGETLIRSIEAVVGPQVTLFGGMAGDDFSFTGTYVFTQEQSTDHGMVALVLDEDKIALHGMALSGWKAVGISRIATKTDNNLLFEIDHKPALEMYLRFLGMDAGSVDDQFEFFDSVGVHYPFQVERPGRTPMMCNPIGYDREQEALICESNIIEGSSFRFSMPPEFDIIETITGKAKELKEERKADADALLIFSCAGRLSALGPMAEQENEGLQDLWKVPMAGFYTYGEFGPDGNGRHEVFSTTCAWVAFKEK